MTAVWLSVVSRVLHPEGETRLRTLYVRREPDGCVEPFAPLLQYFIDKQVAGRVSWQRECARSVLLFLSFLDAAEVPEGGDVPAALLQQFVACLLDGTDRAPVPFRELRWRGTSPARAQLVLHHVSAFGDWLADRTGRRPFNPWRCATPAERLLLARRQNRLKEHSLIQAGRRLREQWSSQKRTVSVPSDTASGGEAVKAFDEAQFHRFLRQGFVRTGAPGQALRYRYRLRDLLIVLLLHGGGLRVSECFHLWVGDVQADPERPDLAQVRLYHPALGRAPVEDGQVYRNRADYLERRYNRNPRHQVEGRFHAGWKNLAISERRDGYYSLVHWFPTFYGKLFLTLFREYLEYLADLPAGDHPYLFVSEKEPFAGEPYTIDAFKQSYGRELQRAGLTCEKYAGTSTHGHRHAYAVSLAECELGPQVIARALRHRSLESQSVYTKSNNARVGTVLEEATRQLWDRPEVPPDLAECFS